MRCEFHSGVMPSALRPMREASRAADALAICCCTSGEGPYFAAWSEMFGGRESPGAGRDRRGEVLEVAEGAPCVLG